MGEFSFQFLDVVVGFTSSYNTIKGKLTSSAVLRAYWVLHWYYQGTTITKVDQSEKSRVVDFEEESRLVDFCKTRVWTLRLSIAVYKRMKRKQNWKQIACSRVGSFNYTYYSNI